MASSSPSMSYSNSGASASGIRAFSQSRNSGQLDGTSASVSPSAAIVPMFSPSPSTPALKGTPSTLPSFVRREATSGYSALTYSHSAASSSSIAQPRVSIAESAP